MDTKSRRSHKLAKLIIALCVMLPAFLLVSLYPTMEKAMLDKREYYQNLELEEKNEHADWVLADNFTNYAMEAGYYLYAQMFNSVYSGTLNYEIFEQYAWDSDCWYVKENTTYIATYMPEDMAEPIVKKNADKLDASIAKLTLEFDSYGNLTEVKLDGDVEVYEYDSNTYEVAERSNAQFRNNVANYEYEFGKEIDEQQYVPKNFKIELGVNEYSDFVSAYDDIYVHGWYDYSEENLYGEIGAYWIVIGLIFFVAIAALTLPFINA